MSFSVRFCACCWPSSANLSPGSIRVLLWRYSQCVSLLFISRISFFFVFFGRNKFFFSHFTFPGLGSYISINNTSFARAGVYTLWSEILENLLQYWDSVGHIRTHGGHMFDLAEMSRAPFDDVVGWSRDSVEASVDLVWKLFYLLFAMLSNSPSPIAMVCFCCTKLTYTAHISRRLHQWIWVERSEIMRTANLLLLLFEEKKFPMYYFFLFSSFCSSSNPLTYTKRSFGWLCSWGWWAISFAISSLVLSFIIFVYYVFSSLLALRSFVVQGPPFNIRETPTLIFCASLLGRSSSDEIRDEMRPRTDWEFAHMMKVVFVFLVDISELHSLLCGEALKEETTRRERGDVEGKKSNIKWCRRKNFFNFYVNHQHHISARFSSVLTVARLFSFFHSSTYLFFRF